MIILPSSNSFQQTNLGFNKDYLLPTAIPALKALLETLCSYMENCLKTAIEEKRQFDVAQMKELSHLTSQIFKVQEALVRAKLQE